MPWILGLLVITLLAVAVWLHYSQKSVVGDTTPEPAPASPSTPSEPIVAPVAPVPAVGAESFQIDLQSGFDLAPASTQAPEVKVSINGQQVFSGAVRDNMLTGLARGITVPEVAGENAVLRVEIVDLSVDQTFTLPLSSGRYVGVSYNGITKKLELKQQTTQFEYD